jgi:hypothetical protein
MSSLPPYFLPRDNQYLFRDSTGRIVKAFNWLNPSLDSLTKYFKNLEVNTLKKQDNINNKLSLEDKILNRNYFLVAKIPNFDGPPSIQYNHDPQVRTLDENVGLINRSGELVVPYSYKDLKPIGDYFLAYKKDKIGIIDSQNNILVPITFDRHQVETNSLHTFWLDNACQGIFDFNPSEFSLLNGYQAIDYIEGLVKYGYTPVQKDGKYGLINSHFEEVIPVIYDEMKNYIHLGYFKVKKEKFYGFVDTTGNVIIPIKYLKIGAIFLDDRIWFTNKEGKYGFLDRNGKEIIAAQYDFVTNFYVNKAIVYKDGFAAFIDKKGNLLTDYKYKQAQYQREQFVVTNKDGDVGLLNAQLKEIIPCQYKRIHEAVGAKKYYWWAILPNGEQHKYKKEGERIN